MYAHSRVLSTSLNDILEIWTAGWNVENKKGPALESQADTRVAGTKKYLPKYTTRNWCGRLCRQSDTLRFVTT